MSTEALQALSNNIAKIVAQAGKAIVSVNANRRFTPSGIHWRNGIIVTSDESLKRYEDITVTLANGTKETVLLIGRDPTTLNDNPKLTVTSASLFDSLIEDEMQLPPDVLLLDWSDRESLTLIQQSNAATIILISELEDINLGTVLAARIKGILPQTIEESEIIAAIVAVAAGLVVLHPGVIDNLSGLTQLAQAMVREASLRLQN
ncbi:MAG: hypothetical protein VKN72_07375 [Nostocales cyanobacterium 94392]|nr:hypothetical protein [Nostocales cyanobacterium 94392]